MLHLHARIRLQVTYPNFLRFLQHTKVPILSSDMSFAVTRSAPNSSPRAQAPFAHPPPNLNAKPDVSASAAAYAGLTDNVVRGAFEWAGTTPAALFCQPTNLFDPAHWRMVWDILRFNVQGLEALRAAEKGGPEARMSIGQWLNRHRYGEGFRRNYLIVSAVNDIDSPLRNFTDHLNSYTAYDGLDLEHAACDRALLLPRKHLASIHAQPPPDANLR